MSKRKNVCKDKVLKQDYSSKMTALISNLKIMKLENLLTGE